MQTITLIVSLVTVVLLVLALLQRRNNASRQDIHDLMQVVQSGPAKLLVENVDKVKQGDTKDDVERTLGRADSPTDKEWIYYLDKHSGYVISFDNANRVVAVKSWKS